MWDSTKFLTTAGAERLTEIVYPAAADPLGTCPRIIDTVPNPDNTTSPLTRTPPTGARVTIPSESSDAGVVCHPNGDPANGSDDYEIEIRFNKAYDPLAPVVGQVCITYIRTGDLAATQCQILPGASAAQGVCDTP